MAKSAPVSPVRHRKIGAYRVVGELGRGGMAHVYRGVHELLGREVAIKELLPEAMRHPDATARFKREALALASFRHENIVTLYDLVEKNDSLFMVMELVDGPTLSELLRKGPLPPAVAAVIGARVASALEHAHFNRIVHRDLKPSNIMLTRAGEVKLMDFGIAKDAGKSDLTQEGIAIGTPSYMSPEQAAGQELDGRTDQFSLGVVLYEALSGQRPFQGANSAEVFARLQMGKFKPLSRAAPHVPRLLVRVVHRAMRIKPADRFRDAATLLRHLEAYLTEHVNVSHGALLLAFLKSREEVTEQQALAHLSREELQRAGDFERAGRPESYAALKWTLAALGAGGLGTWVYLNQAAWLEWLKAFPFRF